MLSIYKNTVLTLVLLLLLSSKTFPQTEVLYGGEELYYEVNYSFINIGWAKFTTEKITGQTERYICRAKLKSNNSLPLIDVDFDFISEIEIKNGKIVPHKFTSYQYKDGKKSTEVYDFLYDSALINIKRTGYDGRVEIDKKLRTSTVFQDGLSIFYFARANTNKDISEYVPVLMQTDTSLMKIDFSAKRTDVEIGEFEGDIASVYLEGFSYFTAVFGLTGEFSGWFSYDKARIPLKAKLQVEIGSITLELKSWKHGNWQPPKF
ncbi:MAG TPA: DUF3108 domain-containing protein [Ignavibacteria bacterium]|nr:DUF3108 domain-containing protein [Ignavibacteria bacterium]